MMNNVCREESALAMSHIMVMETAVSQLVAGCSACERIKNTPMPFAIVVHLRYLHLQARSSDLYRKSLMTLLS